MVNLRTRLAHLATLLFFVAHVATPHAGFFAHTHAGGEHEHVHLDDGPIQTGDAEIDRALSEALGDGHRHHHHACRVADGQAGFEAPGDAPAHWHAQSPFQHAIAVSLPSFASLAVADAADVADPRTPAAAAAARTRARSPPAV